MEVEVEIVAKSGLIEKRQQNPKRLKRQVSIQEDPSSNKKSLDKEDDIVFLNDNKPSYNHQINKCLTNLININSTFRPPFVHHSLKKAKSLNQTLFTSTQNNYLFESSNQFNFYLEGNWGWYIVFFVFLLKLIINGPVLNFNLIYFYLKTKVFPNNEFIEIIGCLNKISGHLVSPILINLIFKYKVLRLFTILGCMLTALTLLFSAFSFKFHQFLLSFSLMNGIFSEVVQICSTVIITQYFKRKLWIVEMIILLSNGVSLSVFSILIHFLFSEYSWRKSLQILSVLTWCSLILALFFRPSSIYHPHRRAILHLKQQRQKFKQRLPERKLNNKSTTYKLSDHFRQQSLEIAKDDFMKTSDRSNTSCDTSANKTGSLSSGINGSNIKANENSSLNVSSIKSNLGPNNTNIRSKITNSISLNSSSNSNSGDYGQSKQSKFKTSKRNKDQKTFSCFSFLFQRQSTKQAQNNSIQKKSVSLFNCLNKQCLNNLSSKLIQSTNLVEYLDLLKSRDLKFIAIFSFLSTFTQIYISIPYTNYEFSKNDRYMPNNTSNVHNSTISNLLTATNFQKKKIQTFNEQQTNRTLNLSQPPATLTRLSKTELKDQMKNQLEVIKNLKLINSINFANLSKVNIEKTTNTLELIYLNNWFSLGYCTGIILTSVLVSRLYLTSKTSCKLAILGSCFNLIMISILNTCSTGSLFAGLPINNSLSLDNLEFSLVSRTFRTNFQIFLQTNVYSIQIILFIFYGYFQAKLNYSTSLLLIERFSNKKLCKCVALQRFVMGLGHLFLLFNRLALNYINNNFNQSTIYLHSICPFKNCGQFISNLITFLSAIVSIVFLNFLSNRSINRFKKKLKKIKVLTKKSWVSKLFFVFKKFKIFKIFKFLKLIKTKSDQNLDLKSNRNRFKYRKQLSDSNLKDINKKSISSSSNKFLLNKYSSDQNLLKNIEDSVLDLIDIKSNYLINCNCCGRNYLVNIDFEKIRLIELCLIDDLEFENQRTNKDNKINKLDKIKKV